jgi:hypothetical protein
MKSLSPDIEINFRGKSFMTVCGNELNVTGQNMTSDLDNVRKLIGALSEVLSAGMMAQKNAAPRAAKVCRLSDYRRRAP